MIFSFYSFLTLHCPFTLLENHNFTLHQVHCDDNAMIVICSQYATICNAEEEMTKPNDFHIFLEKTIPMSILIRFFHCPFFLFVRDETNERLSK